MNVVNVTIKIKETEVSLSSSDTRATIVEKLGEPEDIGGFFGKKKIPLIFKYDDIEFHFDIDDSLRLIYQDDKGGSVTLCINLQQTV